MAVVHVPAVVDDDRFADEDVALETAASTIAGRVATLFIEPVEFLLLQLVTGGTSIGRAERLLRLRVFRLRSKLETRVRPTTAHQD